MSLKETINNNWKEAFKARDTVRRDAYDIIKQKILVAEKSGLYDLPLTDEQIVKLIIKECKEREELLTIYTPSDTAYITAKTFIEEFAQFLPKQLSEDEVIAIIEKIKETENNPGKIIGLTAKEVGNRFDKSKIAAIVNKLK